MSAAHAYGLLYGATFYITFVLPYVAAIAVIVTLDLKVVCSDHSVGPSIAVVNDLGLGLVVKYYYCRYRYQWYEQCFG